MASVLVVAAHPDDELLGVGGTILRHLYEGDRVAVHVECSRGLRDGERRTQTMVGLARDIGYTLTVGESFELGDDVPDIEVAADIVYTHHPNDLNRDHRLVTEGVRVACRPYTANVRSLRYFETPSSSEWGDGFSPALFVDVDAHLAEKVAYLRRYASEMRPYPHPRSDKALIERARYWGSVSGFKAAEPFVIGRERW